MSKKFILILTILLVSPLVAFAGEEFKPAFKLLGERGEVIFPIVNLLLAIIVGIIAIKVAALLQGGATEKVWNWLAGGMLLFIGLEVVEVLKHLKIFFIGGLGEFIEFAMLAVFFVAMYSMRKTLMQQILGKQKGK